jgi:hypothetical protein
VLEALLPRFAPGRSYPEREVDAILKEVFADHCTLRRALVDFGYLARAGGTYRRRGPDQPA